MLISSTASSAERPRHGAPALCAVSPSKVYSTDTMPLPPPSPHDTPRLLPTCVNRTTSTSLKTPSRTYQALVASCSSATPGHSMIVPGSLSRSMIRFTAIAATTLSGMPVLWPSPWPGAPAMIGSGYATPGFCDACGMPSMSEPSAITGLPEPHLATHAVGMPATPRCTVKPNFSSCPVR